MNSHISNDRVNAIAPLKENDLTPVCPPSSLYLYIYLILQIPEVEVEIFQLQMLDHYILSSDELLRIVIERIGLVSSGDFRQDYIRARYLAVFPIPSFLSRLSFPSFGS